MVNVTFASFFPLLTSSPFCPPVCLQNISPAVTSSLPLLPPHLLIPQANSAPEDVTCHIMSAESLCHLHCHGCRKQTRLSFPTPLLLRERKKKRKVVQDNFKWHITEKRG